MSNYKQKPFDKEKVLAGAKVETKEGLVVTNLTHVILSGGIPCLVGLTIDHGVLAWKFDGSPLTKRESACEFDLVMSRVKRSGWVNIYADRQTGIIYHKEDDALAARVAGDNTRGYLDTIEIFWEE